MAIENGQDNRFWLIPIRKDLKYDVVDKYSSNDWLVELDLRCARRKEKSLPRQWKMRVIRFKIGKDKWEKIATNLPEQKLHTGDKSGLDGSLYEGNYQ